VDSGSRAGPGFLYVTDVADKLFEIFSLDLDGRIGRLRVDSNDIQKSRYTEGPMTSPHLKAVLFDVPSSNFFVSFKLTHRFR
jgi:hypothetical protein